MPKRVETGETKKAGESSAAYRRLALALPQAVESSHMGSPDFRIDGRIFATLAYRAKGLGTLMLAPEQQAEFLADAGEYFTPAPGAWGRGGSTLVRLDAPEEVLAGALQAAYRHVVAKSQGKTRRKSK
ncbi:MAG TPA: MmcQ/YjbR family DNA-binding protein [Candidatus Aquilonibacter sp.]|nr:MmcQ/YjbR family DNA-binding protein [Candidatus Aquilonibacter sp.]